MKEFPEFWFEGNLFFDYVLSMEDLYRLFNNYDGQLSIDEILDKSKNCDGVDYPYYGLRRECDGNISLREFLVSKGFDEYIK